LGVDKKMAFGIMLDMGKLRGGMCIMEFVPLRDIQRGRAELWETIRRENGRVIVVNKGRPAFLLVDLQNQNVLSLVKDFDALVKKNKTSDNGPSGLPKPRKKKSQENTEESTED
jgi:hypothetical protein